jgi:hypothetical protein
MTTASNSQQEGASWSWQAHAVLLEQQLLILHNTRRAINITLDFARPDQSKVPTAYQASKAHRLLLRFLSPVVATLPSYRFISLSCSSRACIVTYHFPPYQSLAHLAHAVPSVHVRLWESLGRRVGVTRNGRSDRHANDVWSGVPTGRGGGRRHTRREFVSR